MATEKGGEDRPMVMARTRRSTVLIIVATVGVILYLAFMFLTQGTDLSLLTKFPVIYLITIPWLVLAGYLFREYRWSVFLKSVNVTETDKTQNFIVFFCGLSMAVSPGKFGELIKSYLMKATWNVNYSKTVPVIVGERLTDLISVLLLACLGAASYWVGLYSVLILFIIIIVGIVAIQNERVFNGLIGLITRMERFKPYKKDLKAFHKNLRTMLSMKHLAFGTLIGLFAWGFEATCLLLIIKGAGLSLGFFDVIFIFSFSSIIGVVTMLPGGIGTMEASMVGVLLWKGLSLPDATFVTFMIRLFTLWFAVIIGVIALQLFTVKFNIDMSKEDDGKQKPSKGPKPEEE